MRLILYGAFFISGAASLAYEIVWVKWLEQITGSAAHAAAIVLSVWMGGMALGSLIFGRVADRTRSPLRLYGLLELGAGAYALCAPAMLPWLSTIHGRALLVAVIGLAVPTVLLGGTWPAFCRATLGRSKLAEQVPVLYGVNLIGAAVGCLATGFWLIPTLGLRGTNALAAAASILVGAAMLLFARAKAAGQSPPSARGASSEIQPAFLLIAALGGLVALACEVTAFRSLRLVVGSTVYALSTMLGVFLAGLALGSLAARLLGGSTARTMRALAAAQAVAGLTLLWTSPLFPHTWSWFGWLGGLYAENQSHWASARSVHFAIAASAMLIPAACLGAVFPLVNVVALRQARSSALGAYYAANTLGAVAGPLIGAFVLMPALGLRSTVAVLAAGSCGLGVLTLMVGAAQGHLRRREAGYAFLACAAALSLTLDRRTLAPETADSKVLFYQEGALASIRVERRNGVKVLVTDNSDVQGADPRAPETHPARLGLLPALLHPRPIGRALQIGLGTGINASALASVAQSLEIVEILPELPRAARLFAAENHDLLDDPRVTVTIDDGRNYLRRAKPGYDVIVSDLFFPENAGAGQLYTQEHFALCRRAAAEDGLVVQWLPLHQLTPEALASIARTFLSVFPDASLWWGTTSPRLPTVALIGGLRQIDVAGLKRRFEQLGPRLAEVGWKSPADVLALRLADASALRRLGDRAPLNTDDFPFVETSAPRIESDRALALDRNIARIAEARGR